MDSLNRDYGFDHTTGQWKQGRMGAWNLDSDNYPLAESTPMVEMADMLDFAEGKEWKTRKEFLLEGKNKDLLIHAIGLKADTEELIHNGWKIEVVTNNFTHKSRLYIFHPKSCIIGRGNFSEKTVEYGWMELDFLLPCKEFKKKYRGDTKLYAREFVGGDYINLSNFSTEQLLNIVTERLKSETPKKIKLSSKNDNVVYITELLEKLKAKRMERDVEASTVSDMSHTKEAL